MENVQLQINEDGQGSFFVKDNDKVIGRLEIERSGDTLRAIHTEVQPEAEGKGLAKRMFGSLIDYARENQLTIVPICEYVEAQLKRNPEAYKDVWSV